ncbi:AAA family ATPase [Acidisoma sp. L85]|uniref:nucleotide-binding protein n=1 Tax=Acidisoma sp. L85 TaxID=1641850 RepID=UPI0020B16159|nr:AAA family ATPase [Acidisoma sp. L85]
MTVGDTKGGVGKTTIAINLAILRAVAGRDVLLVDPASLGRSVWVGLTADENEVECLDTGNLSHRFASFRVAAGTNKAPPACSPNSARTSSGPRATRRSISPARLSGPKSANSRRNTMTWLSMWADAIPAASGPPSSSPMRS